MTYIEEYQPALAVEVVDLAEQATAEERREALWARAMTLFNIEA